MDNLDIFLTFDRCLTYQIEVPGALDTGWLESTGKMTAEIGDDGHCRTITTLTIKANQSGLHKLLMKLYSLGLPLISVRWIDFPGNTPMRRETSPGNYI